MYPPVEYYQAKVDSKIPREFYLYRVLPEPSPPTDANPCEDALLKAIS
jgi:hypothetical protein